MKCDVCHDAAATVQLTEIAQKSKVVTHLCEGCAKARGALAPPPKPEPAPPETATAAAGVVAHPPVIAEAKLLVKAKELAEATCPVCGITFAEFRASGRLGCPNDYVAFRRGLLPLLDKIHGRVEHQGKVPQRTSQRLKRQRRIAELRRELNAAIQREEYETAARLRDEIYQIEER